jgi:hypothetical protein
MGRNHHHALHHAQGAAFRCVLCTTGLSCIFQEEAIQLLVPKQFSSDNNLLTCSPVTALILPDMTGGSLPAAGSNASGLIDDNEGTLVPVSQDDDRVGEWI